MLAMHDLLCNHFFFIKVNVFVKSSQQGFSGFLDAIVSHVYQNKLQGFVRTVEFVVLAWFSEI